MGGVCAIAGLESALGTHLASNLRTAGNWETKPYSRLDPLLGVSALVVLNIADYDAAGHRQRPAIEDLRNALDEAALNGVECVVLLSSALVYGAWPNNPVPLTEESALRPDQRLEYARDLAVAEQIVDEWRRSGTQRRAMILRAVPTMSAQHTGALVRALAAGLGTRSSEDDAPAQFLHEDDLVSAIRILMESGADGVYNVAPDGAIPSDTLRALSGAAPRIKLPSVLADAVSELRWNFQRGPIPPGLRPYVHSPWIVSNDKLRSIGWEPTVTNEQAFVEGTESKWWTMLTPKRKQEISLGLMVLAGVAAFAGLMFGIRRFTRGK